MNKKIKYDETMTAMPCVAVVVPVFNNEKYLHECVESIQNQTYCNLEIILVDDGSTDASAEICDTFAKEDKRIKVLHLPNGGPAKARNKGVETVESHYITFIDSDDTVEKNYIEYLLLSILKTNTDISQCGFKKFRNIEKIKHLNNIAPEIYLKSVKTYTSEEALSEMLYQKNLGLASVWGKIYKTSLLKKNPFIENIIYEDLEVNYRILEKINNIAISAIPLYNYRLNTSSLLHTFSLSRADAIDVTSIIEKRILANHPYIAGAAKDRSLSAAFNIYCITSKYSHLLTSEADKKKCEEIKQRCWQIIKRNRFKVLFDKNSRLKNKLAIIISISGGKTAVALAGRFIY